jgi:multidrug efflux pump
MARFFIDRPVFAWVLAIAVMLAGLLSLRTLPVAQYPSIAPPAISISVSYPGASAETVQSTVVQVIEQQLSGIDNLLYFTSQTSKDGSSRITLSFRQGTNPDTAQVQVQNKVQLAVPRLPQSVQQQGIRVAKSNSNFLMIVGFVSTDGRMGNADISDFLASNVQDPISRTPGVGDYQVFGSQYAMRIWLDPAKLLNYSLTPGDVATAIRAQNVQVSSGEMGALPSVPGQQLNATIIGSSYLQTAEEFGSILLKVRTDGSQVRLRDVSRIEIGSENYAITTRFNGQPASGIGINLASGANALDAAAAVRATVERLRPSFPAGLEIVYPYDTTPFVRLSITSVVYTLMEAVALVFFVMFIFLQNLRATLIPTLAVPVVLLGTFAVLQAAGFSINTLTMFGVVLAIGLLVDDAIVVVENVERVMAEEHLSALEATRRSMDQITGALIGIGLVLSAVFLPMAFFGGSTGVIFRQFSITIATAMAMSVLVAIIFTPALCATMLRPHKPGHGTRGVFGWFNRGFDRTNRLYIRGVQYSLRRPLRMMLLYVVFGAALGLGFFRLPGGFLPNEDQGVAFFQVGGPPRRHHRAHPARAGRGHPLPPGGGEGCRCLRVRHQRVQLQRPRPEFRPGLHQPARLGRPARRAQQRAGADPPHRRTLRPLPGCGHRRLRAAGDPRARQCHRLHLPASRQRRTGPCRASRRARPAARPGRAEPATCRCPAQRPERRGAVPPDHRLGAGERTRALGLRRQHDAFNRLGRLLRQRLRRSGPGQTGLSAG